MIQLKGVSKSFDGGETHVVRNVSLEVGNGELFVLLGSSGSGKTTTLKMINRLIDPTGGEISIDGRNIMDWDPVELRRSIGYVFQGIGLFPHMTIEENVSVVLRLLRRSISDQRDRARELLYLVHLDPDTFSHRYPGKLSGGQQQRVGVARALAANPEYLLMDESFGAVDAVTRDTLQQELLSLKKSLGKTILFVTHDIFEALTLADRIGVMHEGQLEQIGAKDEILKNPKTDFVKRLFEKPARQLRSFLENP